MTLSDRPAARAKLVGGRLCLDFVNTVGGRGDAVRDERLTEYADLLAWGLRVGVLAEADAARLLRESRRRVKEAAQVFARALALREAIWHLCHAVIGGAPAEASDLEVLNRELAAACGRARLAAREGNFAWEWAGARGELDEVLWRVADSTAEMLTTSDLTRLRECRGDDCGWLFEDASRNRSRLWCDMGDCGNLAKVRRFRRRGMARG